MTEDFIAEFLKKHPIYSRLTFHSDSNPDVTSLHPILPASQAVIDSFVEKEQKRVAIVFPDENINVIPLVVAKYFANVQGDSEYSHSIFDDIKRGQHLKLGKAIVEFESLDRDGGKIVYLVGSPKKDKHGIAHQGRYTSPIEGYFLYFERSNGALTSEKTYNEERKVIKKMFDENGMADMDHLAVKRTVLNKSIALLSSKKDFREFLEGLYVSGRSFGDVATYGEFDFDSIQGTKTYNSGKLDCLPGLIATSNVNDLSRGISLAAMKNKLSMIVVMPNIFLEIANNVATVKRMFLAAEYSCICPMATTTSIPA